MYIYFRKKLRSEIQKSFPSLSDGDAAEIIPSKDEVTTVKIYASAGDNVYIYCVNKQPLLFEFDKEKVLYPTGKKIWALVYNWSSTETCRLQTHNFTYPNVCKLFLTLMPRHNPKPMINTAKDLSSTPFLVMGFWVVDQL